MTHAPCPVVIVRPDRDRPGNRSGARIVVGVDGSEHSRTALHWALEEAAIRSLPVVAVHGWVRPHRPHRHTPTPPRRSTLSRRPRRTWSTVRSRPPLHRCRTWRSRVDRCAPGARGADRPRPRTRRWWSSGPAGEVVSPGSCSAPWAARWRTTQSAPSSWSHRGADMAILETRPADVSGPETQWPCNVLVLLETTGLGALVGARGRPADGVIADRPDSGLHVHALDLAARVDAVLGRALEPVAGRHRSARRTRCVPGTGCTALGCDRGLPRGGDGRGRRAPR